MHRLEKNILHHAKKQREQRKVNNMKRKDFINKYILPNEEHSLIIKYLDGSMDYDDDYLNEIANDNNIKIN